MRRSNFHPASGRRPFEGEETEPSSLHKYVYVSNNPTNKRDPSGKTEITIVGQVTTAQVDAVLERIEIETALAGLEVQLAAEAISGYAYFLGVLILTAALSQKGDGTPPKDKPDQDNKEDEQILYRFGFPRESAEQLEDQASKAEGILGIHGVSVRSRPGKYPSPSAPRRIVESHFPVHKTGEDPFHYTVELPKPVTDADAELFNDIFGRKKKG